MAATASKSIVNTQALNSIFKSLGERGKEGEKWKEYTENVTNFFLQKLSELLNKTSQNRIMFRPYGSAVEDLKSQEPNDVGDVDIVIYPTADHLMINDELIEYLPNHPLHVRIKGADHPVLQSCLVGGTEYVATSALKSFHPAVYGSSSPLLVDFVRNTLELMSLQEFSSALQCTSRWEKNKANSPAVTLNFNQSFGSISEQMERLKDPQNLPNLDANTWELLAHFLCTARGIDYTKEHAEVVNDILQLGRDIETTLSKRGLSGDPQTFPLVLQKMLCSDRAASIKARVRDIESRSQSETGRMNNSSEEAAVHNNNQQCVTAENCQDNEGESSGKNVAQGAFSEEIAPNPNQSKVTEPPAWPEYTGQSSGNAEKQPLAEVGDTTSKQQPRSLDDNNDGVEKERERHKRWFEHLFKKKSERKEEPLTEESQLYERSGGIDFVPAFRSQEWPQVAQEWIKRERKWPSPDTITNIIQDGFHLVVKAPKNGNPDCDFRISFSHAEYLLSQEMNDIQRECYRCLKRHYRSYLSTEPNALKTFHLKNIFLQTIEETGAEMWTESNRAACMMKLFENLMEALTKKVLPHFFVRSYNLFCVDYIENTEILESLARKVEQIMESPMQFAKALIQKQVGSEEAEEIKKKGLVLSSELTPSTVEGCEKTEEARSIESKQELVTVPVIDTSGSQHEIRYRYHDLKDIFLAVSKELTDMAFNDADCSLEARDPLEKPLVDDLREIVRNHSIQVEEFPKMFEISWDTVYHKVWLDNEPNMRRRVLHGIQGVIEMWKYMLKQDDFAPGNEAAIARRMLDPGAENTFDLSHVIPAGSGMQLILRFFNSLEPRPAQPREDDLDGMPLD